jgi:hypothetical protein
VGLVENSRCGYHFLTPPTAGTETIADCAVDCNAAQPPEERPAWRSQKKPRSWEHKSPGQDCVDRAVEVRPANDLLAVDVVHSAIENF